MFSVEDVKIREGVNKMCGDTEFGRCDICGEAGELQRKYYYYDIKCDCHSPKHFEVVRYCKNCSPKPPFQTKVTFSREKLQPREGD